MEMIKAAGLKKYYVTDNYEVHALDGVSLSVEEGEFPGNHRYIRKREDDITSDLGGWMNPLQVASGYAATV